jgi:hypothetical protein
MLSENTQKQLQLILGIFTPLVAIIGLATDILDKITAFQKFGPWLSWPFYVALFAFGIWLLYKRGTRHSRLLKPDSLRLERDNTQHLVGRADDIANLVEQCLAKQVVFLEGESGSGKSALVRAGLLPKLKEEKTLLPLMLSDRWIDEWERGPFQALRSAVIMSATAGSDPSVASPDGQLRFGLRNLTTLSDVERALALLNDHTTQTPLIIFDQFDDYQARNRQRFLRNKIWLDPATLRQTNAFWDMVARLVEQEKLRCLFVTRSDTAAGLSSVQFLGSVQALRLDRVGAPYIAQLLRHLTEDTGTPVIMDPEAGWTKLRDRIIRDVSEQEVVLPQQLKIILGGIQSLKWLNVAHYERVGGAIGIEAFYIEQQISGTARKVGLDANHIRAMLVALIDPLIPTKTWSRSKEDFLAIIANVGGQPPAGDKLDDALEELRKSEIIRSSNASESGRSAYRLDHDYLTRGVSAVERRANRWHHLLEDRAKDFQNAGTLWKKWKALLPVGTQSRLVWERLRGRFQYGKRRTYAVLSLARLPVRMISFLILFVAVFAVFSIWFAGFMDEYGRTGSAVFLKELRTITDLDRMRARTREFETSVSILTQRRPEEVNALALPIIEEIQNMTNADQVNALADAIAVIVRKLEPDKGQALGGSILERIQSTTDAAQLTALTQAFAAVSGQLPQGNARALADAIVPAIKGSGNSGQRRALGLALATIAPRLKLEEGEALDGSIVEAIRGERALPWAPTHR